MIKTEQELNEAVASADGPLRIIGGGTRPIGNPVEGAALRVGGLSGVTLYEPGALTIVVRAGTPLAEVKALLESEGQRLAFEPMDHRGLLGSHGEPTIGGVVAANISGPRRISAGACRDFLLGVRFVDGVGRVVKNGGRVMKNVTGYDLVKLMAGSFGTLGVLSEVSLKVLPKAEASATVIVHGLDAASAVEAMSRALGSPFDVTGAAHLPEQTMIRLEGFADSVTYRAGMLKEVLGGFGEVSIEDNSERSADIWQNLRDVSGFHGKAGDVWRISVRPSDGPKVGARLGGDLAYDWGGGLVWALVPEGTDVRAALAGINGHARLERGSGQAAFAPQGALLDRIAAELRAKFDPRGILNPGLMG
ncbi:MAG: FAD-binding protein [Alphaproteobacteria bacterium]|nr:FAD-binding protein [Alphaproteobacteria bacterium]